MTRGMSVCHPRNGYHLVWCHSRCPFLPNAWYVYFSLRCVTLWPRHGNPWHCLEVLRRPRPFLRVTMTMSASGMANFRAFSTKMLVTMFQTWVVSSVLIGNSWSVKRESDLPSWLSRVMLTCVVLLCACFPAPPSPKLRKNNIDINWQGNALAHIPRIPANDGWRFQSFWEPLLYLSIKGLG